jgi:hypothetical protein
MSVHRVSAQRRELLEEFASPLHRERRGNPDVVEYPGVVVEAKEE